MFVRLKKYYLLIALASFVTCVQADDIFSGHIKYQAARSQYSSDALYSTVASTQKNMQTFDGRVNLAKKWGNFDLIAQFELLELKSSSLIADKILTESFPMRSTDLLPSDRQSLFDLTNTVNSSEDTIGVLRADRLSIGYTTDKTVFKIGRQALSLGNGLLFQVLDPLSPFSPTAIDKDYKVGAEMLYSQYLFDSGADLQVIIAPRRNVNGSVSSDSSSYLMKYQGRAQLLSYDLSAAQHYDDTVFGAGGSVDILEATSRFDIAWTRIDNHSDVFSFVLNLDRNFVVFDHNLYLFAEYFRNGFGEADGLDLTNEELFSRIGRGELFTLGKNYIGFGSRLEITPLLNFFNGNIVNLDDQSAILQLRCEYEVEENFVFVAGHDLPFGGRGSEFGGLVLPNSNLTIGPSQNTYLKLSLYF